jgi:methylated-DNA-[protein]-cysteine S-methyltransferase
LPWSLGEPWVEDGIQDRVTRPRLIRYHAPRFGVGEVWLDEGRVLHSELPRPGQVPSVTDDSPLARRLEAFFAGEADDFADVDLDFVGGFYGECARVLRAVPRGEVVTYGELAALAGHPGAARAAGTFCARNRLSPFVPCHRVVGADGIGSFGSLGVDYKRRLLALEHVAL